MPIPANFKSSVTVTHINTAAALLTIDGVTFLTDPVFDPAGTDYPRGRVTLHTTANPALQLSELPVIDAVLLSHEDHPDNLDTLGRTLLNGRHVLTTEDGAKKLAPRPGVQALRPWQSVTLHLQGKAFKITGTPCVHLPGGECVGFVIEHETFGVAPDGRPNVVFFSGDTIYTEELSSGLRSRFNVVLALVNFGAAASPRPDGSLLVITMDAKQGTRLCRELDVQIVVPMHFDSWRHFSEEVDTLHSAIKADAFMTSRVQFLVPGKATNLI